jgi:hypothetical protein
MNAEERTALLASFAQLWERHSDLRFGQLLRESMVIRRFVTSANSTTRRSPRAWRDA